MNPIRRIVQDELERSRAAEKETAKLRRKRSSKKKRAAGIGAGAVGGAMMGLPVGLMGAVAMGLGKRKIKIHPPKGSLAQMRYYRGDAFKKELAKGIGKAQREALIGLGAGAAGGGILGGLAGHEISKHAAAISSRITPGSSSVRGYSYDAASQSMLITFKNGGTYRYKNISPDVAKAMGRNKSVGKTVHKRIKQGGYEYEKVGAAIENPMGTILAPVTGMGNFVGDQLEKHEEPLSLVLGTALGASAGLPLGAVLGGRSFAKNIGAQVAHPNPKAGALRKVIHTIRSLPKGSSLRKSLVHELAKGGALGALTGVAGGGLFGYQVSKGHRRNKEMRSDIEDLQREMKSLQKAAEELPPHEPPPVETPISERVFENLTMKAKTPQEENATQGDLIMDKMASRRRQIAKLAGAAKKQVTWQGLTMKLEHEKGDERSGVNGATGKKWSRVMRDGYGYMPGTYGKGADGEAIDVYFNPDAGDEVAKDVYKIRQKKKTGEYDEDKFMVGYSSAADARKAFLRNMPKWAFDSMSSLSLNSFKTVVGQDQKEKLP